MNADDFFNLVATAVSRKYDCFTNRATLPQGVYYQRHIILFQYNPDIKAEQTMMVWAQHSQDRGKMLGIRGFNSLNFSMDMRSKALELIQEYGEEYTGLRIVLDSVGGVLKMSTQAQFGFNGSITPGILEDFIDDFVSANHAFLRWWAEPGRSISS